MVQELLSHRPLLLSPFVLRCVTAQFHGRARNVSVTGDFTRKKWKDKVKLKRVDGDDELWETEVCPAK